MNLSQKTYNALFWSFIDRGGEQVIRFSFSVILARLLLPEHFGLIGMALVITELSRLFVQSGFGLALINNQNANKIDECSVFYFNLFIGLLATTLLFIVSPYIASFYKRPELVSIIRVLSITVFIGSVGTIQTVLLTKNIDFHSQTKVGLPATIVSGTIGIFLAYKGLGVWALVYQTIIRTLLVTSLLWVVNQWRPQLLFSFKSLSKMFGFGSKLLIGSIFQMLFDNLYVLLIGKLFVPAQLGFYTKAKQMQLLPIETMWSIIGRVTYPVMSTLKGEPKKFQRAISKVSKNVAFVVFPFFTIGAIVAPGIFKLIFGETWMPSVPMFQILCFANIFLPLEHLRNSTILAKGNSSLHFKLLIFKNSLIVLSVILSYKWGINGILIALGVASYIQFLVNSYYTGRATGYSFFSQLSDLAPYALSTATAAFAVLSVSTIYPSTSLVAVVLQSFIGFVAYIICGFVIKLEALKETFELLASIYTKIIVKTPI